MSQKLVKDYATDLGYEYLTASNKDEFNATVNRFLTPEVIDRPILFEVFTETENESNALETVLNMISDPKFVVKNAMKQVLQNVLGDDKLDVIKKMLK